MQQYKMPGTGYTNKNKQNLWPLQVCIYTDLQKQNMQKGETTMAVVHVTKENFDKEVLQADKPVLVDFWATWCGPCQMAGPIVEELAQEHPDIKVCKIDTDQNQELAMQYGVSSIPAFFCFKNGKIAAQSIGLQSKEELWEMTQKN